MDIDSYRQVIGIFQFKQRKMKKFMNNKSFYMKDVSKVWEVTFCLISYLIIFSTLPPTTDQTNYRRFATNQSKITKPINNFHREIIRKYSNGISWMFPVNNNAICHSLNGNRRNLGYKYFMWNCDRGVLSENKIEDIKLFAEKRTPHIMAIIEVNLTRNEENINEDSVTQLIKF